MPSLIGPNLTTRPKKQQQPAAQFQGVFRIKQNKNTNNKQHDTKKHAQQTNFQLTQSATSASSSMTEEEHVFHSRRSHRKSRLGCGNCKKRRVKCDETKPECTRCLKYGVTCDFSSDASISNSSSSSSDSDGTISSPEDLQLVLLSNSSPDMAASSMSLTVVERSIAQIVGLDNEQLGYGDRLYLLGVGDLSSQLMNLSVLHNFITRSTEAIPDAKMKNTMKTGLIRTAFGNAHLMHTVLAASYLHLNHTRPGNKHRRVQEAFHWQRAIQLYQGEIQAVIGPHNTDALLGSCILMGMNTLLPAGFKPQDSWVFTRNPADLNWLALQGGLRCLIEMTEPFIANSIWGESFQEAGDRLKPFQGEVAGRVDMHEALADLCEIDDSTTPETNPYHWHIQLLSRMLTLEPFDQLANYNIFVSWMGQILPEFITLLRVNDERALLILSWWMALMCATAPYQVWIYARIVPECQAVCMYLEENSSNPEILRLVQWPAAACGYRDWTSEALERVTISERFEWT